VTAEDVAHTRGQAQKVFLAPYKDLSQDAKSDLLVGLRDLKSYTTANHRRFRDSANKTVSGAKETVARILASLDSVLNLMRKKFSK
jgi:hypothetical protein